MAASVEDLDLHGVVGVRLLGASAADAARVRHDLSPARRGLERPPDIVLRFVPAIEPGAPERAIGLGHASFTDSDFLLRDPASGRRARIPFEQLGEPCEVVCETGIGRIPLLKAMVHLAALSKGYAPAHASAVVHRGRGIVSSGWTSGGKTGFLLTLMSEGSTFVSDDVVYVGEDGRLLGLHEPLSIKDYYLNQLPSLRSRLEGRERWRLRMAAWLERMLRTLFTPVAGRIPARTRARMATLARNARTVHVRPERLFGAEACAPSAQLECLILTLSHSEARVRVEPADPREAALRMAFSTRYELLSLAAAFLEYRFAFPRAQNPRIESAETRLTEILLEAIDGCRAFTLAHPYPASISDLAAAIRPLLEADGRPEPS